MPSSFTSLLKLELPATGELTGAWGETVNNAVTTPISEAIAGTQDITIGAIDYTLTNGNGSASNEARKMIINATGSPGADRNVICPATSKLYLFYNNTTGGYTMTLKTASGTGIAVPAGQRKLLYCNGTDVLDAANAFGSLAISGNAQTTPVNVAFSATAMTVNCSLSNVFQTTFTANVTVAPSLTNPQNGQTINWFITQDGTGGRTMTWPTSFKWPTGSVTDLSTTGGAVDLVIATYLSATGYWYASLLKEFV